MKSLREHLSYYISLALLIFLGGFLVLASSPYVQLQFLFIVITAFFYIAWGIFHHMVHHDLHARIVVEYVLIGGLVIAVAFFLFI